MPDHATGCSSTQVNIIVHTLVERFIEPSDSVKDSASEETGAVCMVAVPGQQIYCERERDENVIRKHYVHLRLLLKCWRERPAARRSQRIVFLLT